MPKAIVVESEPLQYRTVEAFDDLRNVVTVASLAAIVVLAAATTVMMGPLVGAAVFMAIIGFFLWASLHYAEAKVVDKLIPMVFGIYVNQLFGPGWIYIPLAKLGGWPLGYKTMPGKSIDMDSTVEERISKDEGTIKISYSVYLRIDPHNPIQVIEVGGLKEAIERLKEQFDQCLRTWTCSPDEGPLNVDQARGMNDEATLRILRMLLSDDVMHVSPDIPSEVLIGHVRRRTLNAKEQEMIRETLKKKTTEEQEEIRHKTEELLEFIRQVRNGERAIAIQSLGIIIERFVVSQILPTGEAAKHLDEVFQAEQTARIRIISAEGLAKAGKKIKKVPGMNTDPIETILVAEGKVKKEVKATEFRVGDNILKAVEEPLRSLGKTANGIANMFAGKPAGKE